MKAIIILHNPARPEMCIFRFDCMNIQLKDKFCFSKEFFWQINDRFLQMNREAGLRLNSPLLFSWQLYLSIGIVALLTNNSRSEPNLCFIPDSYTFWATLESKGSSVNKNYWLLKSQKNMELACAATKIPLTADITH